MKRLEELVRSIATVIAAYHDIKINDPIIKSPEQKYNFYNDMKKQGIKSYLDDVITKCCAKDSSRKHFLSYLSNQAQWLNSLLEKDIPFTPKEYKDILSHLTNMLNDFHKLLVTVKTESHDAFSYNIDKWSKITLTGLSVPDWKATIVFCDSGKLLDEEVMKPLHLSGRFPKEDIECVADSLLSELHAYLVVTCQNDTIDQSHERINSLTAEKNKLQEKITELTAQLSQAHVTIADQAQVINQQLSVSSPPVLSQSLAAINTPAPHQDKSAYSAASLSSATGQSGNKKNEFSASLLGRYFLFNPTTTLQLLQKARQGASVPSTFGASQNHG